MARIDKVLYDDVKLCTSCWSEDIVKNPFDNYTMLSVDCNKCWKTFILDVNEDETFN